MANKRISKSQFMKGLQCHKHLWLYNYRKDLIPPVPEDVQVRFDEGHVVGALAREYFNGGKLVDCDYQQLPEAIKQTREFIESSTKIIYESTFVFNNVLVRADILKKNTDGTWDLIEVKSTTEVKDEHYPDVAIQKYVIEGAGLKINKAWLMHINNQFVKDGPIDPKGFFTKEDISAEVADLKDETVQNLEAFMEVLAAAKVPDIGIGRHCSSPYECEFSGHCWKDIPEYSIYDIPRLKWDKKDALKDMGILRFRDVPEDFPLNDGQLLYLRVEKTGKAVIEKTEIAEFLGELTYPLYYIDFETIMPAVPLYEGSRPYQQIPFQLSLHIQAKPGAAVRHLEFLGDAKTDPRPGLARFMVDNIGPKGSLLAYNASFEASRIKELAETFPASEDALVRLVAQIKDLMKPFRSRAYVHPHFHGRYSIKKVLPALIPDMTYEGLAVANGGDAQLAYFNMISGKLTKAEMEQTAKDLKIYCGQDTLAMVKIVEHLIGIV
ncbi:MAG: DUF2779 domain-containing protein [Elusimicrobiota bacterium]|nr:DUF2779 domain-containing protein [Elusimicrobiota bacterium]